MGRVALVASGVMILTRIATTSVARAFAAYCLYHLSPQQTARYDSSTPFCPSVIAPYIPNATDSATMVDAISEFFHYCKLTGGASTATAGTREPLIIVDPGGHVGARRRWQPRLFLSLCLEQPSLFHNMGE